MLANRFAENIVYKIASHRLEKKSIILYSSSFEDKFANIGAVASKLKEKKISFVRLSQLYRLLHPLRFYTKLAKARVLLIDGNSPAAHVKLHPDTCLISCWHACGAYKKMGFDAKRHGHSDKSEERRLNRIHRDISYFVCTSEDVADLCAGAFHLQRDKMLVFGSPRLDSVLTSPLPPRPARYTVLYAPTYRTGNHNQRAMLPLPDGERLRSRLEDALDETVTLAFRGHPTSPKPDSIGDWEDWTGRPQQEALNGASVLVTDYSSIFFDYLPLARPVVFYVPDLEAYQRVEKELYFSPYELFPETTCRSEEELVEILVRCRHVKADNSQVWSKFMSACDGHSSERLCDFMAAIQQGQAPHDSLVDMPSAKVHAGMR
ncbi:MAG: CDP-glycerol glycerophosphotransferase family protein [Desulfovibrio sp.]|nr:CDP-glycerol glycerophosphotransferase family protein [Desulfovibrio sp.]